jgi:RNA polymerase sigma-70 factor (ECF subfamily)
VDLIAELYTREWGRIVATLIRLTGDWNLAEECAQDAFAQALQRWPNDGVPDRPGGWLTTTARNRAMDVLRRGAKETVKLAQAAAQPAPAPVDDFPDDRLRLMFTCCHPALRQADQVALTLRCLLGLGTAEIARAFLVSEKTMAQRLVRAKTKIRNAGIPFRVPPPDLLPTRTSAVLEMIYLLFNEGYASTAGSTLVRADLSAEALRLARILVPLLSSPEADGLLALMLLHDARRPARLDRAGSLVALEDQDRAAWNRPQIAAGLSILDKALSRREPGPYQVQAAIAACHAEAPDASATDWTQIALLYDRLAEMVPSPVVELNRAVAIAMARGPAAGLAVVDSLTDALTGYHLLPATRADLLRRLGRREEAAEAYREALALTANEAERRFLASRLATVT